MLCLARVQFSIFRRQGIKIKFMSDAFYTITIALGYGKITAIPLVVR